MHSGEEIEVMSAAPEISSLPLREKPIFIRFAIGKSESGNNVGPFTADANGVCAS